MILEPQVHSTAQLSKTKADLNFLLSNGQNKQSLKRFNRVSSKYVKIGISIFVPLILLFALGVYLVNYYFPDIDPNVKNEFRKDSIEIFLEGFKIWLGALATYIITVILTNRWQQRSVSFEMIKELNSVEFHKVRCFLVNEMEKSITTNTDIENMDGWLPYYENAIPRRMWHEEAGTINADEFYQKHALASMLYFILRVVNYKKFDMLNVHLTRHLFHFFFCHYEILMLEFGEALKRYTKKQIAAGFVYDSRWELTCRDISLFFSIVGLSGELAPNHTFIYFPSLNQVPLVNTETPSNIADN